jgi:hypothetical protein
MSVKENRDIYYFNKERTNPTFYRMKREGDRFRLYPMCKTFNAPISVSKEVFEDSYTLLKLNKEDE